MVKQHGYNFIPRIHVYNLRMRGPVLNKRDNLHRVMALSAKSRPSVTSAQSKSRSSKRESVLEVQEEEAMPPPDQFAWKVLSQEHITRLNSLTIDELANELARLLSLNQYNEDLQQAATLDYFVSGYIFAHENHFTCEQQSAFFTLLHKLLENIKSEHLSLSNNLQQLGQYLSGIGISQQTSLQCFTLETAHKCLDYIHTSLIQHYQLFQFLFEETQEEEHIQTQVQICLPPDSNTLRPAPLEEAVTEEFHNRFIAPHPPLSHSPPSLSQVQDPQLPENTKSPSLDLPSSLLLNITPEEVKSLMKQMTSSTISIYQEQLLQKLKDRETTYTAKLSKIEKSCN